MAPMNKMLQTAIAVAALAAAFEIAPAQGEAESANYDPHYIVGAVTVNKHALTVTASSHNVTYGDAAPTVTPSYSGDPNFNGQYPGAGQGEIFELVAVPEPACGAIVVLAIGLCWVTVRRAKVPAFAVQFN